MGNCELVNQLNRLRKSSSDSIDAISRFDDFKKYMHVSRRVEQDLIDILNKVNSGEKKTLVLLCGSAGDGKSHLLSFLKNEEKLLDNYIVYNDATESSSPSKTAIDTLAEALQDFTDENVDLPGKNFILAINLGVLSNFIESKYGNSFKKLHEYVITSNILTNQLNVKKYDANSPFQHVSFSDYHMYTLTEKGAVSDYLEQILEKVFSMHVNNPFYCVYEKYCRSCPISERCPVKHNFEFLMEEKIQKFIAYTLVEVVVKDKEILTTREIFNYIYDIVVPQKFNPTKIAQASTNMDLFLKEYIKGRERLTREGVNYIVHKYFERARLKEASIYPAAISAHCLRHTKAMHLLENGVNLIYIRDLLGHTSVTTTEIYSKANPEVKRKHIEDASRIRDISLDYSKEEKEELLEWLKNSI